MSEMTPREIVHELVAILLGARGKRAINSVAQPLASHATQLNYAKK